MRDATTDVEFLFFGENVSDSQGSSVNILCRPVSLENLLCVTILVAVEVRPVYSLWHSLDPFRAPKSPYAKFK